MNDPPHTPRAQVLSVHRSFGRTLWNRREVLKVGSISIAATAWPGFAGRAAGQGSGEQRVPAGAARSVILLWMAGGVTHIDSFDPKPEAPEEVRGTLQAIGTTVPGVRFCETLPCLARQAHRLAVVRSYSHDSNDHFLSQAFALSGRKVTEAQITTEPNLGSIVSKLCGARAGFRSPAAGSAASTGRSRPAVRRRTRTSRPKSPRRRRMNSTCRRWH